MASLVSAIPEGLPAILTIVLTVGAFRMAKRNAIIRRLPSTETLSVVDTIITDKTGTLTENKMTVQGILIPGEKEISVEGVGWIPRGDFKQKNEAILPLENKQLTKLLHVGTICNNARLVKEENDKEEYNVLGDPTEAAILVLAEKAGIKKEIISANEKKIDDLSFNQKLKYRASLSLLTKENKKQIYVIGAPEVILKNSSRVLKLQTSKKLTQLEKRSINRQIDFLTNKAMRAIAFAYKDVPAGTINLSEEIIKDLTYLGVVGIKDPPRQEVRESIEKAKQAGIRVIMATGDHKNTALAIAKEIGLEIIHNKEYPTVLIEEELEAFSQDNFEKAVRNVNIFARLTPHMKFRIVKELQKTGSIIAVTGDGVNDASALKEADIGISMGIIGTDVARESSDIILADDNFSSIINAIEEGRIVNTNTKNTSYFLVTTNFAEAITIISTMAIGLPLPLLPTQILWLNLVTDTGSGLGLALEPGHNHIREERPKNPKENILTKEVIPLAILMTIIMVALTVLAFIFYLPLGVEKARTAAFIIMAITQLYNSLNMRSLNKSLFKIGLHTNKYLLIFLTISLAMIIAVLYVPFFQNIFGFASISIIDFLILLIISSSVLWFGEAYKKFTNKKKED